MAIAVKGRFMSMALGKELPATSRLQIGIGSLVLTYRNVVLKKCVSASCEQLHGPKGKTARPRAVQTTNCRDVCISRQTSTCHHIICRHTPHNTSLSNFKHVFLSSIVSVTFLAIVLVSRHTPFQKRSYIRYHS